MKAATAIMHCATQSCVQGRVVSSSFVPSQGHQGFLNLQNRDSEILFGQETTPSFCFVDFFALPRLQSPSFYFLGLWKQAALSFFLFNCETFSEDSFPECSLHGPVECCHDVIQSFHVVLLGWRSSLDILHHSTDSSKQALVATVCIRTNGR